MVPVGFLWKAERIYACTAEIEIVDGVAPEYFEAAAKGEGGKELADFEEQVRAVFDQQARIAITPGIARLRFHAWDIKSRKKNNGFTVVKFSGLK